MTYKIDQSLAEVRLAIVQIRTDGGTQTRWGMDEATVTAYTEALDSGAEFPPVVVFKDEESNFWLADGFHRVEAYRRAGKREARAVVHDGTRRDAILWSAGANASHGLPRTGADKRRSVETLLADPEWAQWSDRKIAEQCRVSNRFVGNVRGERREQSCASVNGSQMDAASDASALLDEDPAGQETADNPPPATKRKVERSGTTYTMRTGGIGKVEPTMSNPETPSAPDGPALEDESQVAQLHELQRLETALGALHQNALRAREGKAADRATALEAIRRGVLALADSLSATPGREVREL